MSGFFSHTALYFRFFATGLWSQLHLFLGSFFAILPVEQKDLSGKVAIVTGANTGIGFSLAKSLAQSNATVYLACRNLQKAQDAAAKIIDSLGDSSGGSKKVRILELDTSSFKSVRAFAEAWTKGDGNGQGSTRKIDILIHNAGITATALDKEVTADNLGTIYETNHAGPFLLTSLIEKHLAPNARVVFTSSGANYAADLLNMFTIPRYVPRPDAKYPGYSSVYADTKSMQVVMAKQLQERWRKQAGMNNNTRIAHAFAPGLTQTEMIDNLGSWPKWDPVWYIMSSSRRLATPVDVGAATGYWLASTADEAVTDPANGGRYWERLSPLVSSYDFFNAKYGSGFIERLWELWCIDSTAHWD